MKKLVKTSMAIVAALLVFAVGVYAAIASSNLSVGSNVYFVAAKDVKADISGRVIGGALTTEANRTYVGKTYNGDFYANPEAWTIGDIGFTTSGEIQYEFIIQNAGAEDINVTISFNQPTSTRLTLTGGLDGVDAENVAEDIAAGDFVTFTYTLTLDDLDSDLAKTSVSFSVEIEKVAP